jgi:N-acetylglucosaminyl-diphospho-decaprenol L-rhamnosyltransferase
MQVTVAIVSWNTRDLLRRCLESFEDDSRCEVWVVDNASSDGSAEMVRDEFPWVRLEALDENIGFGRAVNRVAAQTDSPWLAIANADIALEGAAASHAGAGASHGAGASQRATDALGTLIRAGDADPRAGAFAPRLRLPYGSTQHSVFSFPTIANALIISSGIGRLIRPLGERALLLGSFDPDRPRVVPWAVAAFLLVRREAWDAIGGFDERQWMYAEDLDLGWRLRQAGWHTRYVPDAVIEHSDGAAARQAFGDTGRTERWQRATYAWMLERMGPARTRAVALIHIAGQLPRLLGSRRAAARWWIGLHRAGLASRRELEPYR